MYICINRNNINVYSTCINRGTDKQMYFHILFGRHNAAGCYGAASPPPLVAMALPHLPPGCYGAASPLTMRLTVRYTSPAALARRHRYSPASSGASWNISRLPSGWIRCEGEGGDEGVRGGG